MKKNVEWLKEEVEKDIEFKHYVSREHILGLIDELDEPEVLTSDWIKDNQLMWTSIYGAEYYVPANKLYGKVVPKQEITEEQALRKIVEKYLLTPNDIPWILDRYVANVLVEQPKKPVIPSYVADLMEDYNDASIHSFLSDAFRNYREGRADRADTWITKNPADFVDAYRYGYTVEEKKYYILLPKINRNWLYVSLRSNYDEFIDHYTDSIEDLQAFTEKEIKAIEPRYFAFAVPVEELEE